MRLLCSLGLALLLAAVSGSPCLAQRFVLPIDAQHGLEFGSDKPRTPYLFAAEIAPGIAFDRLQLHALIAPSYLNPAWDLGVGARVGWFVPFMLRDLGVGLAAQAEYLPFHPDARLSLGVVLEALGLLRLATAGLNTYDRDAFLRDAKSLGVTKKQLSDAVAKAAPKKGKR